MNNEEIRAEARSLLTGRWNKCVIIWLIYFALTGAYTGILGSMIPGLGSLVSLVVGGPFMLGIIAIFFKVYRKEEFIIDEMFYGFREFNRALVAYLWICLYTLLWSLLLIVPGIIASVGYSQTFLIMHEDKNISPTDAMNQSKAMMMGHKTEFFMLQLSFIGWACLSALTFGIGFLWFFSYVQTSNVIYYHRLRAIQENKILTESYSDPALHHG